MPEQKLTLIDLTDKEVNLLKVTLSTALERFYNSKTASEPAGIIEGIVSRLTGKPSKKTSKVEAKSSNDVLKFLEVENTRLRTLLNTLPDSAHVVKQVVGGSFDAYSRVKKFINGEL